MADKINTIPFNFRKRSILERGFLCMALLFILFTTLFPIAGNCRELSIFDELDSQLNLPNCTVSQIIQDKTGFLWMATHCGLFKYDGYTFREYRHITGDPNSLSHNRISCLMEDHKGTLWVGTHGGGLNRYYPDNDQFEKVQLREVDGSTRHIDDRVVSLLEDHSGKVWIGTRKGLVILNPDQTEYPFAYRSMSRSINLDNEEVISLYEDREGYIWIGTRWQGLLRYDPSTRVLENMWERFENDVSNRSMGVVRAIFEDSMHHLWIGTSNKGLYRLNPQRTNLQQISMGSDKRFSRVGILHIVEDTDQSVWVATNEGVYNWVFNPDISPSNDRMATEATQIIPGRFRAMLIDRFEILWAGKFEGGVARINLKKRKDFNFYHLPKRVDGSDQNIRILCEDVLGRIWVKTEYHNDIFWILDPQTRAYHKLSLMTLTKDLVEPDMSRNIKALTSDKDGIIWVLSDKDTLFQIDPLQDKITRKISLDALWPDPPQALQGIETIAVDTKGRLWMGGLHILIGPFSLTQEKTEDLLYPSNQNKVWRSVVSTQFSHNVILIYEGPTTGIWVVTGIGHIYRYHEKEDRFNRFALDATSPESIEGKIVFDLYEDAEGWVWLATDQGLLKLDTVLNRIVGVYNSQSGLSSEVIKGIVQDKTGDFWLGTLKGLVKFDQKNKHFIDFGIIDAVYHRPGGRISSGQGLKSRADRLYFTSKNKLVAFDPETISTNTIPPEVVITDVRIIKKNTSEVLQDLSINRSRQHGQQTQPLLLSFYQDTIKIEYAGIHFNYPAKNQYAIMLEGLDTDWRYVQTKRTMTYTNLMPGSYVFRVKAANSHGLWNETSTCLKFVVLTPYWMTWWFVLGIVCVLIIFIVGIIKWQTFRVEQKNRTLKDHVAKRTQHLEKTQKKLLIQEKLNSMSQINRLEKEITNISERTRRQLGEALHDDICPHFLGVEAQADVLASRLSKKASAHAPLAKEIQTSILEGIEKTRSVGKIIAPNYSMERGLRCALDELAVYVDSIFNVHCKLTIHGNVNIFDQSSEIDLYYIVQEAIYNAIKHGKPQEIEIVIKMDTEQLHTITIMDDGCGIEGDYERARGMGLRIMDFRARRLGGTLEVKNNPMGGGMVQLTLDDSIKVQ